MIKLFFRTILILLVFANLAFAEDLYVTSAGAGAADGLAWASAWSWADMSDAGNWGAGAGAITAGDTVYISGGASGVTYTSAAIMRASGTDGNLITFSPGQDASHNGVVTITNASGWGWDMNGTDYITVNGEYSGANHISIKDGAGGGIYELGDYSKVLYVDIIDNGDAANERGIEIGNGNDNWEIAYCLIDKAYASSIYQGSPALADAYGNSSIHHNTISNIGFDGIKVACRNTDIYNNIIGGSYESGINDPHIDGIQASNAEIHYTRIWNNYFYDLDNSAIYFSKWDTGGTVQHVQIWNNLLVGTGLVDSGYGLYFQCNTGISCTYQNILIANNTFANWDFPAIRIAGAGTVTVGSDVDIVNNVIINSTPIYGTGPLFIQGTFTDSANNEIDYNLIYEGAGGQKKMSVAGTLYDDFSDADWGTDYASWSHNLNSDPSLDVDYEPDSGSDPVVEAGKTIATFSTDKESVSRPQGTAWDIGCYEFASGAVDPVDPPAGIAITGGTGSTFSGGTDSKITGATN